MVSNVTCNEYGVKIRSFIFSEICQQGLANLYIQIKLSACIGSSKM